MPRPAWMRIGTPASRAQAKIEFAAGRPNSNAWARGWSLMPRAPRARQRWASPTGASARASGGLAAGAPGGSGAAVGNAPAAALGRPLQDAVVRSAVAGMAVGVVQ